MQRSNLSDSLTSIHDQVMALRSDALYHLARSERGQSIVQHQIDRVVDCIAQQRQELTNLHQRTGYQMTRQELMLDDELRIVEALSEKLKLIGRRVHEAAREPIAGASAGPAAAPAATTPPTPADDLSRLQAQMDDFLKTVRKQRSLHTSELRNYPLGFSTRVAEAITAYRRELTRIERLPGANADPIAGQMEKALQTLVALEAEQQTLKRSDVRFDERGVARFDERGVARYVFQASEKAEESLKDIRFENAGHRLLLASLYLRDAFNLMHTQSWGDGSAYKLAEAAYKKANDAYVKERDDDFRSRTEPAQRSEADDAVLRQQEEIKTRLMNSIPQPDGTQQLTLQPNGVEIVMKGRKSEVPAVIEVLSQRMAQVADLEMNQPREVVTKRHTIELVENMWANLGPQREQILADHPDFARAFQMYTRAYEEDILPIRRTLDAIGAVHAALDVKTFNFDNAESRLLQAAMALRQAPALKDRADIPFVQEAYAVAKTALETQHKAYTTARISFRTGKHLYPETQWTKENRLVHLQETVEDKLKKPFPQKDRIVMSGRASEVPAVIEVLSNHIRMVPLKDLGIAVLTPEELAARLSLIERMWANLGPDRDQILAQYPAFAKVFKQYSQLYHEEINPIRQALDYVVTAHAALQGLTPKNMFYKMDKALWASRRANRRARDLGDPVKALATAASREYIAAESQIGPWRKSRETEMEAMRTTLSTSHLAPGSLRDARVRLPGSISKVQTAVDVLSEQLWKIRQLERAYREDNNGENEKALNTALFTFEIWCGNLGAYKEQVLGDHQLAEMMENHRARCERLRVEYGFNDALETASKFLSKWNTARVALDQITPKTAATAVYPLHEAMSAILGLAVSADDPQVLHQMKIAIVDRFRNAHSEVLRQTGGMKRMGELLSSPLDKRLTAEERQCTRQLLSNLLESSRMSDGTIDAGRAKLATDIWRNLGLKGQRQILADRDPDFSRLLDWFRTEASWLDLRVASEVALTTAVRGAVPTDGENVMRALLAVRASLRRGELRKTNELVQLMVEAEKMAPFPAFKPLRSAMQAGGNISDMPDSAFKMVRQKIQELDGSPPPKRDARLTTDERLVLQAIIGQRLRVPSRIERLRTGLPDLPVVKSALEKVIAKIDGLKFDTEEEIGDSVFHVESLWSSLPKEYREALLKETDFERAFNSYSRRYQLTIARVFPDEARVKAFIEQNLTDGQVPGRAWIRQCQAFLLWRAVQSNTEHPSEEWGRLFERIREAHNKTGEVDNQSRELLLTGQPILSNVPVADLLARQISNTVFGNDLGQARQELLHMLQTLERTG